MRLKLISCEILYREICAAVARSVHQVDVEFLPKGFHDIGGAGMCERLQAALDKVDESLYEAVMFGYALCGNGLAGLTARSIPVVGTIASRCSLAAGSAIWSTSTPTPASTSKPLAGSSEAGTSTSSARIPFGKIRASV